MIDTTYRNAHAFPAGNTTAIVLLVLSLSASSAMAEEQVGVAITVRNDVTGKIQSQTVAVADGSDVFGKELVKTFNDSSAKIVLKDNTNINIGPNSSVTLDKFVFAESSDYKQAALTVAKGAFRFTSGSSDKRAYDIRTSSATIGIRGTDFSAIVTANSTHIEVTHGNVIVCPRMKQAADERGRGCLTLIDGQAANVANNSVRMTHLTGEASQAACIGPCEAPTDYSQAIQSASNAGVGVGSPSSLAGLAVVGVGGAGAAAGAAVAASNNNNNVPFTPFIPSTPQPLSAQ